MPKWFAEVDDTVETSHRWQPHVSWAVGMSAALDIWFPTEDACEEWIRKELGYEVTS